MNTESLVKHFQKIGARIKVTRSRPRGPVSLGGPGPKPFDLNIARDKAGEHFTLRVDPAQHYDFRVLQANTAARQLLLYATEVGPAHLVQAGERFLCGHDERHWFAAKVDAPVTTITAAKRELLPIALREAGLTPNDLARRQTTKFKRQGEWFFLPVTDADKLATVNAAPVLHGEPLVRSRGGKPHYPTELVRFGGQPVVIVGRKEYSNTQWEQMLRDGTTPTGRAQHLRKDPEVYVRGKVRHPDHATLTLDDWHRVLPNREGASPNLSFYD